jgi:translocation and assembly module TamB
MPAKRRPGLWLATGLMGLLLVVVGSVLFLIATEAGARIVVDVVLPRLPASVALSVADVRGRLLGPLQLHGVRLEVARVGLAVEQANLTWHPRALLGRRLVIEQLTVTGLAIVIDTAASDTTDDDPDASADSAAFRLPFPIEFGRVVVDDGAVLVPGAVQLDEIHLEAAGSIDQYRADGSAHVVGPSIPEAHLRFAADGSLESIVLEQARTEMLDGTVDIVGAFTWLPVVRWDVTLQADSIAYGELLGDVQAWPGRMHVGAETAGTLDGYRVEATLNATRPRLPPTDVHLVGRGTTAGFEFEEARADILGGRARVAGSMDWTPAVAWDVTVALDSVVPAPLLPDSTEWPGTVTLHGQSRGQLVDGAPRAVVVVDSLYGRLRNLPLGGHAEGEIRGSDVMVEESRFTWGDARFDASGQWADSVGGQFALHVPDLAALHPRWAGVVRGEGTVAGSRTAVRIDAALAADGVRMDSLSIARARGVVEVEIDSTPSGVVHLDVTAFSSGAVVIDSASLHAEGTSPAHSVAVQLNAPRGDLTLDVTGRLIDRAWHGMVGRFDVAQADIGDWSLASPVSLTISDSSARVDALCLAADDSSVCGAGTWHRTEPWSAQANLTAVPVALLGPFIPEGVSITGAIDGTIIASAGADGVLDADLAVTVGPGEIDYPVGRDRQTVDYQAVVLRSTIDTAGWVGTTSIVLALPTGEDIATIDIEGALPAYHRVTDTLADQPLTVHLAARIADVSLMRALDPSITRATGRAMADLTFSGTVGAPIATGEARYEDGEIHVPDVGITLEDVELVATGDRTGGLHVEGHARSGSGTIATRGSSPLVPSRAEPATLTITGEGFQAVDIPEADVVVSPDVRLTMTRDSIDLTGEVALPRALIELTEVPANAVPVSNDVVFVDVDSTERRSPITVTSSVRVVLGDRVTFRGFGFRADLAGTFLVEDLPNQPTTGSGTVTLSRGRYRAHGQDLRIDDGRVIFNGPVDDPALNIRAYREARDRTIAGRNIRGTLKRPEATVFSNPSMSQSEAMSYLMFGRPLNQGSTSEQNRMTDAAAALGGDMLAQSLGAKVGFEAGLEQGTNPNEAALVAGTYLSPQLFVAYGVGLFDRINIFRVRYEFTHRWSVQAESSRESSADVFFTFERK